MGSARTVEAGLARLTAGLFGFLILTILWTAKPWDRASGALRPDTGAVVTALDDTALRDVLIELLGRVYAAFGQEEEGAIYDGLATAVSPDLLTDLYLQRRAAQEGELEEGGTTEIRAVELTEMTVLTRAPDGYRVDAAWRVTGEVGHEDHRHERINAYSAVIALGPSTGEWRLTEFDLNRVIREDVPLFFGDFDFDEPAE